MYLRQDCSPDATSGARNQDPFSLEIQRHQWPVSSTLNVTGIICLSERQVIKSAAYFVGLTQGGLAPVVEKRYQSSNDKQLSN